MSCAEIQRAKGLEESRMEHEIPFAEAEARSIRRRDDAELEARLCYFLCPWTQGLPMDLTPCSLKHRDKLLLVRSEHPMPLEQLSTLDIFQFEFAHNNTSVQDSFRTLYMY